MLPFSTVALPVQGFKRLKTTITGHHKSFWCRADMVLRVAAYNHIGWTFSFPPAYLLYLGKEKQFCITVTQSLDTVGTKVQYPAFFWLPDVWVDHTSTPKTSYQHFLIMWSFPAGVASVCCSTWSWVVLCLELWELDVINSLVRS